MFCDRKTKKNREKRKLSPHSFSAIALALFLTVKEPRILDSSVNRLRFTCDPNLNCNALHLTNHVVDVVFGSQNRDGHVREGRLGVVERDIDLRLDVEVGHKYTKYALSPV